MAAQPGQPPQPAQPMLPVVAPRPVPIDPGTRRQTLIVATIIGALFFGSQILNEALPGGTESVEAGETITVVEGVTLTGIPGWVVTPHEDGGVRLEKGVVVVDLFSQPTELTAAALAQAYLAEVLEEQATELTATELETATGTDGASARFRYQGIFPGVEGPIEGEATILVGGGTGVVADAWSPQGGLDTLLEEARKLVASIELAP